VGFIDWMMSGKSNSCIYGVVALVTVLGVPASAMNAQSMEEKAEICAGCHGMDGKPVDKTIPTIWGQQLGYLYIQLARFQARRRKNDIMQPIASSMERDDMLAIADYFSKKAVAGPRSAGRAKGSCKNGRARQWLGWLHRLPPRSISGRWNGAPAGRHEPGISDQNHRRLSYACTRQQSGMSDLMLATAPDDLAALAEYLSGR